MSEIRRKIEQQIVERAMKDEDFRNKLQNDPRSAVEETLGIKFPDNVKFYINVEGPNDVHITIPAPRAELTEEELAGLSGGWQSAKVCDLSTST